MSKVLVTTARGLGYDLEELLYVLEDARSYITPTLSTHEEISEILGWCDCGYCKHVEQR